MNLISQDIFDWGGLLFILGGLSYRILTISSFPAHSPDSPSTTSCFCFSRKSRTKCTLVRMHTHARTHTQSCWPTEACPGVRLTDPESLLWRKQISPLPAAVGCKWLLGEVRRLCPPSLLHAGVLSSEQARGVRNTLALGGSQLEFGVWLTVILAPGPSGW